MMRFVILALVWLTALPSAAQTQEPDVARAAAALAAMWRPVTGAVTETAVTAACRGAVEEMAAVEAALPPVLTPQSLERVRALRGLLIVPTGDDPAWAYFFPAADLAWFSPGIGQISVLSEAEGILAVRDAAGNTIGLQLGRAGARPILRVRPPEGAIINYVGCAPVG